MEKLDIFADKIFSLLKGNNLKITIFDKDGAETTDPLIGRRFFVSKPNIMVTINEDDNSVDFSKGTDSSDPVIKSLQRTIRDLTGLEQMDFSIKVFGKSIEPRDYAYQVKNKKDTSMNEMAQVTPNNSFILGKVFKELDYAAAMSAEALADNIPGADLNQVQQALNRLVMSNKVTSMRDKFGNTVYSKSMEEAIAESEEVNEISSKLLARYKTKAADESGKAFNSGDITKSNKRFSGVVKATNKQFDNDKKYGFDKSKVDMQPEVDEDKSSQLKQVMKHNSVKGQDNRDLELRNGYRDKPVSRVTKFAFPETEPKQVQKKPMTPFSIKESFSKMFGSMKTSQQTLENVRILVKHKSPVDENIRGSRSRQIGAIFLECNGERFRFPNTYLPGARAMAQHMAHGGTMGDKVGSYISESIDQLLKLQSFNRYVTTNKLVNESSSEIINTIKENIQTIRTELKKITGTKTYETVKARIETFERSQLDEADTTQLKDLFTIRRFDEKFEEVLPIVKQLVQEKDTYHKRIEEAASRPVRLSKAHVKSTPILEFASDHAKLGYKINEFALRIVENDELSGFVSKIGNKICKEGQLNSFERAILSQILENASISDKYMTKKVTESFDLDTYFDRFVLNIF